MQPRDMPGAAHETSPLLQDQENGHDDKILVEFSKEEDGNPRTWSKKKKLANIAVIASMSILSPLVSSMFTPGIKQIAESLNTTENGVIGCQTGFVVMLVLYLWCFTIFTLLQIPTALAKTLPVLVTLRTLAGFFGSVGIANGGGTISDMYDPSERAEIFGWYLLGPLLGPSLGPLLRAVILQSLDWPWLFWITLIICTVAVIGAFLFLRETYVPVLLQRRKKELENSEGGNYYFEGQDDRSLRVKLGQAIQRPVRILFTQPIVLTMAAYQALLFAITYSLYTQFESIYGEDGYSFSTLQLGLVYLGPGLGFLVAVWFLVPRIGSVYNSLTKKHNGEGKPEYRLPIANVGAILIPISLFWFAWSVEFHVHVAIFNSVQNYYIDSFEKYAASAIAAGALFRSVIGGIVPLLTGGLLEKLGVGWGMSVFGFISVALAPSPLLFWYYGEWLRKRFAIDL